MLGTKRRAPSTLERESSTPASSKRLKPNHPHQPPLATDQRGSTTGTWLTPIWNSLKSLVGATPTTQSGESETTRRVSSSLHVTHAPLSLAITPHSSKSTRRNDSNRSRQKPLSQNRVATVLPLSSSTPFGRIHDDWIWQTMNAKQRGQPAPPEPAIVRELRARMERQTLLERQAGVNARNHNRASSNGGEGQTSGTYQRKKPMGSKEVRFPGSSVLSPFFHCQRKLGSTLLTNSIESPQSTSTDRTHLSSITNPYPRILTVPFSRFRLFVRK